MRPLGAVGALTLSFACLALASSCGAERRERAEPRSARAEANPPKRDDSGPSGVRPDAYTSIVPGRTRLPDDRSPEALLASIAPRVDSIVRWSIGVVPPGRITSEDPGEPLPPAAERMEDDFIARLTVRAPENGPLAQRAMWEGQLVAAALRDALRAAGHEPLVDVVLALQLPDGRVVENVGGGLGYIAYEQQFEVDRSDSEIVSELRAQAKRAGFIVESIDVVHVDQPAPALTLRTGADVERMIEQAQELDDALFGKTTRYEGVHWRIDDLAGEPIFIQSAAFRTGVGMEWMRPELDPRRANPRFEGSRERE
jgi:hypothetical protein